LFNQQSEVRLRVRRLQRQLSASLAFLPRRLPAHLTQVQIVLVDRATIAQVHDDFLGDPTETDVITFSYGEIVVCPSVAREQSPRHGLDVEQEVLLYALHGMLHLVGYEDTTPEEARQMERAQMRLLKQVLETK
jgi:probable rRNA maturation factor